MDIKLGSVEKIDPEKKLCLIETSLYETFKGSSERAAEFDYFDPQTPLFSGVLFCILVLSAEFFRENRESIWNWIINTAPFDVQIILISEQKVDPASFSPVPETLIFQNAPISIPSDFLAGIVDKAFGHLFMRLNRIQLQSQLALSFQEIKRLTRVGQYLTSERDFDRLIELIIREARDLVGADAGSIYVTERHKTGEPPTHLRFKKSDMELEGDEFLLPINNQSIAGYVALTKQPLMIDDVYALTGNEEYRFNYEYDKNNNYYSKSMLVIPMQNHRDEVIGVIQLINKKKNPHKKLTAEEMKGEDVVPFTEDSRELVRALAGQAAVSIENNELYQDINNLFEGFVKASVTAIEQRDPTTSGHSFRVADFTVGLAMAVDRLSDGKMKYISFTREQIREIRYASLLHDFGKVGVREKVLVKANKLYEHEFEMIQWRFHYARKLIETKYLHKKIAYLKEKGNAGYSDYEKVLDAEMHARLEEMEGFFEDIKMANQPNVVEDGNFDRLGKIARMKFQVGNEIVPFLKNNELVSLSVRRGNLDQVERMEIESHVSHTYTFLIQIPWTGDLLRVPDIAHAHHEKLTGEGYPMGLLEKEIPVQSKMMTISDIYDALTAPDRPYKKSLPRDRALDILKLEAKDHRIDSDLLDIFIESDIFKLHGK
ncbi:MAG: GAF domain-containing protein [Spirochaetia bacterium]|nr:GAF domain-containing protein [Spirochaetia bacterium]